MIVPMKKLSLLCLAEQRESTLEALRELGVMHIAYEQQSHSEDRVKLEAEAAALEKINNLLAGRKVAAAATAEEVAPEPEKITELLNELENNNRRIETLLKAIEQLQPWGKFSPELLHQLEERGINVALCQAPEKEYRRLCEQGLQCQLVSSDKHNCYFAVIQRGEAKVDELPLATLPENSNLTELEAELHQLRQRNIEIGALLDAAARHLDFYSRKLAELNAEVEFLKTRDSMMTHDRIAVISGFIPVTVEDQVTAAAKKEGWGLLITEPDKLEQVPTLTKVPRIFSIIKPIFEFIGIAPGYDEVDVSVVFLLFFIVFFAMIIGDAGYGSLFLLAAIICKLKFREPKYRLPVNLFITLSTMTVIWGGLNGNWFGLSAPGIKFFTNPTVKDQNVQLICFILAVAQLSIGRIWQGIKLGGIRGIIGQLGWVLVLWGNFFLTMRLIVFPGAFPVYMYYLYAVGFICVAACDVDWRDMGDVFNFPFGAIGSFVDMLSYIRLFAVGMAGFYIAKSFNDMAVNLVHAISIPAVGIIGAIVVLLFGHILNILLCLMGVLVHGIRLNTLEFSNHVGLRWACFIYEPFRKKELEQSASN